jgi:hypothetical protein
MGPVYTPDLEEQDQVWKYTECITSFDCDWYITQPYNHMVDLTRVIDQSRQSARFVGWNM